MNYIALADRVEKLIAKYGKTLTLRAYSSAYDPVTMAYTAGTAVDTSVVAIEETYKAFEVDGTHIRAGDIKLMVCSSVEPDTSMKMVIDSVEWAIVAVYPLRPADTTLYYIVQARKP